MTSDGKSSLAQENFVESGCSQGHHGIVYSYEMGDEEIAGRIPVSHKDSSTRSRFSTARYRPTKAAR